MPICSILMCVRKTENPHSDLQQTLLSVSMGCDDLSNVEVLIKLDDDDPGLNEQLKIIAEAPKGLTVKPFVTPRGRGFWDLHKACNDLMLEMSDDSRAVWGLSDDARVVAKGIDTGILDMVSKRDIWILVEKSMAERIHTIDYTRSFFDADPYPCWSRSLLEICGGFPLLNCSDSWTTQLIRMMKDRYKIDIFHHWPVTTTFRMRYDEDETAVEEDEISASHAARLAGVKAMHEKMRTTTFQRMLRRQAHNLFLALATEAQFGDPQDPAFTFPPKPTAKKTGTLRRERPGKI